MGPHEVEQSRDPRCYISWYQPIANKYYTTIIIMAMKEIMKIVEYRDITIGFT